MPRPAFLFAATILAAAGFAAPARAAAAEAPDCSLENVASPEEIAAGWKLYRIQEIVDQADSAPFADGAPGNWFINRTTTTIPNCRAFDDMGNYSLRSYMLPKKVSVVKLQVCQATADGSSAPMIPPQGTKPHPPDSDLVTYDVYDKPYAGSCPPNRP